MANQVKIEFVSEGFESILTSEGVQSVIREQTQKIADKANANNNRGGEGFKCDVAIKPAGKQFRSNRAIGFVYTTDHESIVSESEDKALSRAVK